MHIVAFALVCLGLVLTPGPNMIYLVSRTISQGREAGYMSLGGVFLGFVIYMLLAVFGITAMLMAVPLAYDTLRVGGALYLLWLAWQAIKPGGKKHPIDKVLHAGESVTLGGTTLVAHLTAGHTRGCTTWTTTAQEAGKTYNVVFGCSMRAPTPITPAIAAEFERSFKVVRALPCDIQLGDHPAEYGMEAKYPKLKPGSPNPFIDAASCKQEVDMEEAMFHAILDEQKRAGHP